MNDKFYVNPDTNAGKLLAYLGNKSTFVNNCRRIYNIKTHLLDYAQINNLEYKTVLNSFYYLVKTGAISYWGFDQPGIIRNNDYVINNITYYYPFFCPTAYEQYKSTSPESKQNDDLDKEIDDAVKLVKDAIVAVAKLFRHR